MSGEADDGGRDVVKVLAIAALALVVVGVLAVVAFVILAAVVGTFVLGIGSQASVTPGATFDFQPNAADGSVEVIHAGGEEVSASSVEVRVDGRTVGTWADFGGAGPISPGDSIRIADVGSGDSIRLVWVSTEGERYVLDSYEVP